MTIKSDNGYKWTVERSSYTGLWTLHVTPPNGRTEYVESYNNKADAVADAKRGRHQAEWSL